ncbi:MAG: FAD-dependent oxidoreductase [Bryobacteraceae bacterium]|nr:FAD-dependent oxidoreductase [Bryobacteraceae bacterium]MDW8377911.1 FAD-dependent oxidoreductase [Bryobacterales bacterium]
MIPDVAVIGAGSFGAWTAWHLRQAGLNVRLMDAYGAANSRASSGGESRIIRAGYGAREIYTRFTLRSLELWRQLAAENDPTLFHGCGVLWIAPQQDAFAQETVETLRNCGVRFERLTERELESRYSWFRAAEGSWGIFEPDGGALMARRAIQTLAGKLSVERRMVRWSDQGPVCEDGSRLVAGAYVFACGPWLPKLFPGLFGNKIRTSRQEVFFFGAPPAAQFGPERIPCWIDVGEKFYGFGDLENRGLKVACDRHGPVVDPDTLERVPSAEGLQAARDYLSRRIPCLADAPLVETRVCQYENTATGDYLIDQHPDHPEVWIAGGGSGHGFKHGPAVGEYLSRRMLGSGPGEPRFSLASKVDFEGQGPESTFYR